MIEYLRLSGIGIVSEAEVDLAGGLTVLTGETGAGKTMALSALAVLTGGKVPAGLATRPDSRIEGGWRLRPGHLAASHAAEIGARMDDGLLIVSRTVPAGGRGRCALGGLGVPTSTLADLAGALVVVHGQADQMSLRRASAQREMLDRFGGAEIAERLASYGDAHRRVVDLDRRKAEAEASRGRTEAEVAALKEGLDLIADTDPRPGEDAALSEEIQRLSRVDELRHSIEAALAALSSDDESGGAQSGLEIACRGASAAAGMDPALAGPASVLADSLALVHDAVADMRRYLDRLEADPARLDSCQSRLARLSELKRRFGHDLESVIEWARQASLRMINAEDSLDVEGLRAKRTSARRSLESEASALRALREKCAAQLGATVTKELSALAMPKARFDVEVAPCPPVVGQEPISVGGGNCDFGPGGAETVIFRLQPHPGARPTPLAHTASGGELSRVMLAIEVALASEASAETFIFDEIDAGIGGEAATEVGRRLARLGQFAQVIVVTHLAQVAAFADDHIVVEKLSVGGTTTAKLRRVAGGERQREIARMLSGQPESRHALAHASELLRQARPTSLLA